MSTIGLGMAVYNRERYLSIAIESVLNQSLKDWELHIVDDASTDNSRAIAIDYAARDPRIKFHSQRVNQGFGYTLRSALACCNSQYLGWLDPDDKLAPIALKKMVNHLEMHHEAGMAYSHYSNMDEEGRDKGLGNRCRLPYSPDRLLSVFMVFHLHVIRSEAYHSIGGINPGFRAAVDYEFCLRASEVIEIQCVPEILYQYRQHPDSISVRDRAIQTECSNKAVEQALLRRGLTEVPPLKLSNFFDRKLNQKHPIRPWGLPGSIVN